MARSRMVKAGGAFALFALLGVAGYAARDQLADFLPAPADATIDTANVAAPRPPQPVRVTLVAFTPVAAVETYTGTIRPRHELPLGFRQPGKITARLVEVGDRVIKGQTLARLDDTDARLDLEAARAEAAAAATDLDRAQADLVRSRDLFAAGHVAQAALDRATSAAAEATSRADRAVKATALAENRLSYAILVAEADGVVTATPSEAGQVVGAGQPVVLVARTDALDVVFALPEASRALPETATATAELWGADSATYALTLRDISPDVDPVGRTYRVRMALDAPDAATALGRTMTIRFSTDNGAPVVALPLAAVLNDGEGPAVWRLQQGQDMVERVAVDLVSVNGDRALVQGPLVEGDRIVSLGAHKIDATRPVRVVETTATPES
ncbi:MAG: efflux RND transporter periplasmic adaptor subunit [Rhodobacteraceae bacterium]|nr:efflux RND transporter periplasmic adaptor subunit [Paracoccaceae bacterium]